MVKETAIKVSKGFKEFLVGKKQNSESFEDTIKRLVNSVHPVNPSQLTSIPQEKQPYKKEIKQKDTEFVEVEDGIKVEKKLVKQYKEANKIR